MSATENTGWYGNDGVGGYGDGTGVDGLAGGDSGTGSHDLTIVLVLLFRMEIREVLLISF